MPLSSVVSHLDPSRRRKAIVATVTPSGNYTAGGDTCDLTKMTNPKLLSGGFPGSVPSLVEVVNSPAGYTGEWVPGTTLANGKLKVYTTAGAELAAGAYPAILIADPFLIRFSGAQGRF